MTTAEKRVRWASKIGRPTKLTPELFHAIVEDTRSGNYAEVAAGANGIHRSTYFEWLKRGRQEKGGIYRAFADAIQEAADCAEKRANLAIQVGAPSWQSRAWWLERARRSRWSRFETYDSEDPAASGPSFETYL